MKEKMKFSIGHTLELLERTPDSLCVLLKDVSEVWTSPNEGAGTWSVFDVLGHLVQCEKNDWMSRVEVILSNDENKTFRPVDRVAQFSNAKGKTVNLLLEEFVSLRKNNLSLLSEMKIGENDLEKTGIHPVFGAVTLSQLLSTWMVHDLDHLSQVNRVMAKQYKTETGPWIEYLRILKN